MATYSDGFERANGPLGSNWSTASWSPASALIDSGHAVYGGDDSYERWVGAGNFGRHQRAKVTVGAIGGDYLGPMVYLSDANGGYIADVRPSNGSVAIARVTTSGYPFTTLASFTTGGGAVVGDTFAIEVDDDGTGGSALTVYKNDGFVGSYTDTASPLTSGDVGMYIAVFGRDEVEAWEAEDYDVGPSTYTLTGAVTVNVTPTAAFTLVDADQFQGSVTTTVTPASTMAMMYRTDTDVATQVLPSSIFTFYPAGAFRTYTMTGAVTVNVMPTASFSFPEDYAMIGNITLAVTPNTGFRFRLEGENVIFLPGFFVVKTGGGYLSTVSTTKAVLQAAIGGSPEGSVNDLWMKFFDSQAVPSGSINDRMRYWLKEVKGVQGDSLPNLMANWDGTL